MASTPLAAVASADVPEAAAFEAGPCMPAGEVWGGYPSRPVADTRRIWASESQLPELIKRVRALEKRVRELEGRRA